MRILLIEDNKVKATQIIEAITTVGGVETKDVTIADDLVAARDALHRHHFDLLILDMRLPNLTGDDPASDAGVEMLRELNASNTLLKPFHIIGVTAYDDTLEQSDSFFKQELWCLIKYSASGSQWRKQLVAKVQYLVQSKREAEYPSNRPFEYDVAIVTALHVPELQAVLDLNAEWSQLQLPNDPTAYFAGVFKDGSKRLKVIASAANQMGMAATSVLSMKLIQHFRPKVLAMLGIAAGVPGRDLNYGDIIVASQSWNYDSGKKLVTEMGARFDPDPNFLPLAIGFKEKLLRLEAEQKFVDNIQRKWRGIATGNRLRVAVGPLASGSAVIADESVTKMLKEQQQRKLLGIDMETYGMLYAAENCSKPQPIPISLKSVCDFADSSKDDRFQTYAAYTSAEYFREFALSELEPLD